MNRKSYVALWIFGALVIGLIVVVSVGVLKRPSDTQVVPVVTTENVPRDELAPLLLSTLQAAAGSSAQATSKASEFAMFANSNALTDADLFTLLQMHEVNTAGPSGMTTTTVRAELASTLDLYTVIDGSVVLLSSANMEERAIARDSILRAIAARTRTVDFSPAVPILKDMTEEDATQLAKVFYQTSLPEAAKALSDAYDTQQAIPAGRVYERIIDVHMQAAEIPKHVAYSSEVRFQGQLNDLLSDARWWVRMYVAQELLDRWALRSPELVDAIKRDSNAVIRGYLDGLSPYQQYARQPMPDRSSGPDATRLRTERMNELMREGVLDDLKKNTP